MPIRPLQLLVVLVFATLTGCGPPPRLPENAYANKTEAAVRSELGQPDRESAGHYGAPPNGREWTRINETADALSLKQIVLRHSIGSRSVHALRAVARCHGAPAAFAGAWHFGQGFFAGDSVDEGSNLRLTLLGQFAG